MPWSSTWLRKKRPVTRCIYDTTVLSWQALVEQIDVQLLHLAPGRVAIARAIRGRINDVGKYEQHLALEHLVGRAEAHEAAAPDAGPQSVVLGHDRVDRHAAARVPARQIEAAQAVAVRMEHDDAAIRADVQPVRSRRERVDARRAQRAGARPLRMEPTRRAARVETHERVVVIADPQHPGWKFDHALCARITVPQLRLGETDRGRGTGRGIDAEHAVVAREQQPARGVRGAVRVADRSIRMQRARS